jgi:hypothetical protein
VINDLPSQGLLAAADITGADPVFSALGGGRILAGLAALIATPVFFGASVWLMLQTTDRAATQQRLIAQEEYSASANAEIGAAQNALAKRATPNLASRT